MSNSEGYSSFKNYSNYSGDYTEKSISVGSREIICDNKTVGMPLKSLIINKKSDTISLSKKEDKEENNMSAIAIIYNYNGAVIVSDSRESCGLEHNDIKIKTYKNDDIIIGQTGLNKFNNIDFSEIICRQLLENKNIEEIMNQKIEDKTIKELIPENEVIHIYYAKKNGEIGVFDISSKNDLKNLVVTKVGFFANAYFEVQKTWINLLNRALKDYSKYSVEKLKKIAVSSMDCLIKFEENIEEITDVFSKIGGKTQVVSISFNN